MTYLKRLGTWIWDGKYPLLIPIVLIIFQLDEINGNTEDNIRFYGLTLEIIGTLTIAYGLKDKILTFKGHGLTRHFIDHIKSFPILQRKRDFRLEGNATMPMVTISGAARLIKKPKGDDLQDVIRYFEEEIKYLHDTDGKIRSEIRIAIDEFSTKLTTAKNNLRKEISDTKELIKESAISSIWLEVFGLSCLLLGLILGTVPDLVLKIV